ncbi:short chain dehydrogenase [Pseudoalteromonas ruthenica]|uniref:Short chain dehydrogenase n=1 Tax=Pseudoalteromonas ruthenica TaxID=151081 RepID=A0A5S3Z855_9GAMM|nr:SDR family oxidoreductase [Pseudoalteromonas ruthenica]TMP88201.1 short chain dehydrogenase [Pseudoalteromonas ruthenica]
MNLDGKRVWLSGASSGIGEELAKQLAAKGAKLVLSARNEQALEQVKNSLMGQGHVVLPLDLSAAESLLKELPEQLAAIGDIDILINNGGVSQRSLFADTDFATYQQLMAVNYFGTVALTKLVVAQMQARKQGMIVAISSVAGKVGSKFRSGYSGSKYAVVGFMDCIRAELAADGIHCLTVCPGSVQTRIAHNSLNEKGVAQNHSEQSIENGMPVSACVQEIITAIEKQKQEVVIGQRLSYWAPTIKRFFPRLFNRLTARLEYR